MQKKQRKKLHIQAKNDTILYFVFPRLKYVISVIIYYRKYSDKINCKSSNAVLFTWRLDCNTVVWINCNYVTVLQDIIEHFWKLQNEGLQCTFISDTQLQIFHFYTSDPLMRPFVSTAILVCAVLSLLSLSHACPKECSCNSNTKAVDCRGRGLYDIPRRLHPDTQELYLQDNSIRGLGSMAFREIPLVRILDISNNSITTISPTALLGLRMLQRLSLAHNNLRELDKRLLGPIRSLSHLDLSHNRLDLDARKKVTFPDLISHDSHFILFRFPFTSLWGLPGAMGDSLRNLSHLGLAHNRLTRLDRSLLEALTHLDSLALRSNPWRCDCQLIGLKLWLETYLFKGQTTISSRQRLGNFHNISKVHP